MTISLSCEMPPSSLQSLDISTISASGLSLDSAMAQLVICPSKSAGEGASGGVFSVGSAGAAGPPSESTGGDVSLAGKIGGVLSPDWPVFQKLAPRLLFFFFDPAMVVV